MTRLGRWKILAIAVPLGALLILGAAETANFTSRMGGSEGVQSAACLQPSKIFRFTLGEVDRNRVSGLRVRLSPAVDPTQLRFSPSVEEIDADRRDGMLVIRYGSRALQTAAALQMELCSAMPLHEVREAYWIVRQMGRPVTQLVEVDRIDWQWRESGQQPVLSRQLVIRELSCTGQPLVQPYQIIGQDEPLCVKDPEALATIQKQMADLQVERTSFMGKLRALFFGEQEYDERRIALNDAMQKLYLRAPYSGTVLGVTYDERNELVWVKLQVEEETDIRVAP